MPKKSSETLPGKAGILPSLGENLKLARKRRRLTTLIVAERAGIDRTTLYHVERGSPSVALGTYFNVARVYGLERDFLRIAGEDALGRKLQDISLLGGR
jgi:transcriptional regulator with XRE-family HTH domain